MSCTRFVPCGGRARPAAVYWILIPALLLLAHGPVWGDDGADLIQAHLDAGEFGPARAAAGAIGDVAVRDRVLGDIAATQAGAGARRASLDTTYDITSDLARREALDRMSGQSGGFFGPAGGGRG